MAPRFPEGDPASLKQEERGWQDRQGGTLQQRAYARPGTRVVLHGQFARIAEALQLHPGLRLLDVGCGVGYLLAWLAEGRRATYYGLDLSLSSLKGARDLNPTLALTAGDAEHLPYKDRSFDRVICNGTAHHFLDQDSAFRELYRVLVPGGTLVLYEPIATPVTSFLRRVFLRDDRYESPADLARKEAFTPSYLMDLLVEAGFTGISTSRHDFLAYPLSGNYLASPLCRSRSLMRALCRLEGALTTRASLGPLLEAVAWRVLVVAAKAVEAREGKSEEAGVGR